MGFSRMALHEVVDHFLDIVQIRLTRRSDGELSSRSECHASMWHTSAVQEYADARLTVLCEVSAGARVGKAGITRCLVPLRGNEKRCSVESGEFAGMAA